MQTNTVNISFRSDLLSEIDKLAKEESRTRSELIREAARFYIERKERWKNICLIANTHANQKGLSVNHISEQLNKVRSKNKTN